MKDGVFIEFGEQISRVGSPRRSTVKVDPLFYGYFHGLPHEPKPIKGFYFVKCVSHNL